MADGAAQQATGRFEQRIGKAPVSRGVDKLEQLEPEGRAQDDDRGEPSGHFGVGEAEHQPQHRKGAEAFEIGRGDMWPKLDGREGDEGDGGEQQPGGEFGETRHANVINDRCARLQGQSGTDCIVACAGLEGAGTGLSGPLTQDFWRAAGR